jgi:hypothetical protein
VVKGNISGIIWLSCNDTLTSQEFLVHVLDVWVVGSGVERVGLGKDSYG